MTKKKGLYHLVHSHEMIEILFIEPYFIELQSNMHDLSKIDYFH